MEFTPVRQIKAKVELYNGSTLADTFRDTDRVKKITIERMGDDGKFFGYGICQKLNLRLVDKDRELSITTANSFKVYFDECDVFPTFFVSEVNRDENTNELSITAYDVIYKSTQFAVEELGLTAYTLSEFTTTLALFIGLAGYTTISNSEIDQFNLEYLSGANFEGSETLREALNAVAEVTQTIYYINALNQLVFKRLDRDGDALYSIDKHKYYKLSSKTNRRLTKLVQATSLGDNLFVELDITGTTQYIRDNPFWDMREDVATLLAQALDIVGGLTINQFDCEWRGDYTLSLGDKIALTTKDDDVVISYLLNDTIEYAGYLKERTQWNFTETTEEANANPITVGEALKDTFAKVDKVNRKIELVASETNDNGSKISQIELTTSEISATVERHEVNSSNRFDVVDQEIEELTNRVDATISADDLTIKIQEEIKNNGIDSITTETGFTFNKDGLTIEKTGSQMKTKIDEDGMTIYRDDDEVLIADNTGVYATNLHATTYLIIGTYSRFEDFERDGEPRTGCFWIGG